MKKMLVGLVAAWLFSMAAWADTVTLKDGHPETYTVQKGDTLWDISGRFLRDPWLWTNIWNVNPEIENPHLIFPGDVIRLVWVDGKPRLTLQRGEGGRTVKLGPQMRIEPIDTAIPAVPLEKISAWLRRSRIVDVATLERAPYVVAAQDARVIGGAGDDVYLRGDFSGDERQYGIFRKGRIYRDPQTQEMLGIYAEDIASGRVIAEERDIATLRLDAASGEVRIGDRALVPLEESVSSTYWPSRPSADLSGEIIGTEQGVSALGSYSVVVLNRGAREGLEVGNVLAIYNRGAVVQDTIGKRNVKLPDVRAGLLMVIRTFDKASFAIVLDAQKPMSVGDIVKAP